MSDYDVKSNSEITLLPQDDDGIEAQFDPNNDLFLKCWEQYKKAHPTRWVWGLASYSTSALDTGAFGFLITNEVLKKMNFEESKNVVELTCFLEHQHNLTSFNQEFDTSKCARFSSMFKYCISLETVKIDISSATDLSSMFAGCKELTKIEFVGEGNVASFIDTFSGCSKLKKAPYVKVDNTRRVTIGTMFSQCVELEEVPAYDFSSVDSASNMFAGCVKLKKIHFTGMKVDFNISASTQFGREDLVEILTNLGEAYGGLQVLTMGATNLAKLTADDIAIATAKGWTLQ